MHRRDNVIEGNGEILYKKCTVYKKGFLSGCICVNERKVRGGGKTAETCINFKVVNCYRTKNHSRESSLVGVVFQSTHCRPFSILHARH